MRVLFGLIAVAALARWALGDVQFDRPERPGTTLVAGITVVEAEPAPAASVASAAPAAPTLCQTSDRYRLMATLVTGDGLWPSMAVVTDDERPSTVVAVGGRLDGAPVVRVDRREVSLGDTECIRRRRIAAAPTTEPAPSPSTPLVASTGRGRFAVSRSGLRRYAEDIGGVLKDVRARFVRAGNGARLRLLRVAPGSPLATMGLRSGDELHSVDGRPIRSPNDGLQLLGRLDEVDGVEVVIRRRGRPHTIQVAFAP